MRKLSAGIFVVSLASLIAELALMRVFDVLFYPNIAYLIITCSLFAFGLAGVYGVLRPEPANRDGMRLAARSAALMALATAMILPVLNVLPFDMSVISAQPGRQALYFTLMYACIATPFFLTGRILSTLFTRYAADIQRLYFWDLVGAALGSAAIIPLISKIGPGGLLLVAAGLALVGSAVFASSRTWTVAALTLSTIVIAAPLLYSPRYFDFREHHGKRGVKAARERGLIETTVWDPISKIDVIRYPRVRYIAYDGGSQSSLFYPFDGDFGKLRERLPMELESHFWQRGVLASHFLKEGSHPRVVVIGSAGGQEIKAGLMYGAAKVDGVELVGAVVNLGKQRYADYLGRLFHDPRVTVHIGEGRSYLRASRTRYDIIQIFSNHTSSSVAAGTGAVATNYLQTAEAYQEYFEHLADDGILHINHYFYPKMITTAALAWNRLGRSDFQRHVVVFEYDRDETLPTLLIRMTPWTTEEVTRLRGFFSATFPGDSGVYTPAVDPFHADQKRLPADYFSGELSAKSIEEAPIRIAPATDDRPYFNFPSKTLDPFPNGLAAFLQHPMRNLPAGLATLFLSGVLSLLFATVCIFAPLLYSGAGRERWPHKTETLVYFMCLGAGFIIIEFVFIQLFMRLIGSPLYTYSTVLFVMLAAAGVGSIVSHRLKVSPARRWQWPFVGIFATVALVVWFQRPIAERFFAAPEAQRAAVAALMMFPAGFFLGMPFPLGILTLEQRARGAVAWAWGMNGLFTVIGGILAVVCSLQWGFTVTLWLACSLYLLALLAFVRMRAPDGARVTGTEPRVSA